MSAYTDSNSEIQGEKKIETTNTSLENKKGLKTDVALMDLSNEVFKKKNATKTEQILDPAETKEKSEIQDQNRRERGGVALDILDQRLKTGLINRLDIQAKPESQAELAKHFQTTLLYEVLPQLFAAGLKTEDLVEIQRNPKTFADKVAKLKQDHPEKFQNWNHSPEEASLNKFIQIFSETGSPYKDSTLEIISTAIEHFKQAKALGETPKSAWEKTKEIGSDIYNWIGEHKVETALGVAGIITAGLLINHFFKDEKKVESSDDTISKWTKRVIVAGTGVGAIYLLSKIIPVDQLKDKISSLLNFDTSKAKEKATTEKNKFYEKIAPMMGLEDPELLTIFGEYDYDSFVSFTGELGSEITGGAKSLFAESIWGNLADADISVLPSTMQKFVKMKREEPKKILAAEGKLREFLKKHADKIDHLYPKKYLHEVIDGLAREGVYGAEFKNKARVVSEHLVPLAVQMDIDQKYPLLHDQNEVKALLLKVYDHQEAQQENIIGKSGLVERLEFLAQKDPSSKTKSEEVINLSKILDQKRSVFTDALKKGASVPSLQALVPSILEAQEKLETKSTEYYVEIESHIDTTWPRLAFFVSRYALLSTQKKAVIRQQIGKIIEIPALARKAFSEGKDPVGFYERELAEAKKELTMWETNTGHNPTERSTVRNGTTSNIEWREKVLKVDHLEKKLSLKSKKIELSKLSDPDQLLRENELRVAEKEYIVAKQVHLKSSIESAKKILKDGEGTMSEVEKISLIQNLKQENSSLASAIKEHTTHVYAEADRLESKNIASQALREEVDEINKFYAQNVRSEFALINGLSMESRGLSKVIKEWFHVEKESGLVKFVKSPKGRIGVMGLLLVPSAIFEYRDIKEKNPNIAVTKLVEELGLDVVQLIVDVCPFTFGASDWYTVKTGKELITKKEVVGWNRYSHIIWGALGTLLDAAAFIPAVDVVGVPADAITKAARTAGRAGEAKKMIKAWPKIKEVVEAVGGWKKFAKLLKEYKAAPKAITKVRTGVEMLKMGALRLPAAVMIGGVAYNAFYTMGDDKNDPGQEMDPALLKEMESEIKLPSIDLTHETLKPQNSANDNKVAMDAQKNAV